MSVNKIILVGELNNQPVLKQNNQTTILEISTEDEVIFNAFVQGNTAQNCVKYLSKGEQVYIEGNLTYKTSNSNRSPLILAQKVVFLRRQPPIKEEVFEHEEYENDEINSDFDTDYNSSDTYYEESPREIENRYWKDLYNAIGATSQEDIDCFWDSL